MKWKCPACKASNEEVSGICCSCCTIRPDNAQLIPEDPPILLSKENKGADFGIRALARLIDTVFGLILGLLVGFIIGILFYVLAQRGLMDRSWTTKISHFSFPGFLVGLIGSWMYHSLSEGIGSASIGKLCCGLRVASLDGSPIDLLAGLKRSLAYLWDSLFFGLVAYESMKKSSLRQRYGDVWARTIVVRQGEFTPFPTVPQAQIALGLCTGIMTWTLSLGLEMYIRTL